MATIFALCEKCKDELHDLCEYSQNKWCACQCAVHKRYEH